MKLLKKLEREFRRLVRRRKRPQKPPTTPSLPPPTPAEPPPPPTELPPPPPQPQPSDSMNPMVPFRFPDAKSTVLPDPSSHFSPRLLHAPLPTNSFFQNFVLKNGDQAEYIHPYLVKASPSSLSFSYPSLFSNPAFTYQVFNADLTISAAGESDLGRNRPHFVSAFSDLSVTLDLPSCNLRFFLVRGSPYLTFSVSNNTRFSVSTIHAVLSFSCNISSTKHTVNLNNGQTWLIYSSSPVSFTPAGSVILSDVFCGVIRIAILPNSDPKCEAILDRCSDCYPLSGEAFFSNPYCLEYKWEKKGSGDLLMLAHPLHLRLLEADENQCEVLQSFKFQSIDGELVGVIGDSWVLKVDSVPITWHSIKGIKEEFHHEIVSALCKDVGCLDSTKISTKSSYFYGKLIARAARLALIAEEVYFPAVIPTIKKYLKEAIEPWLDGCFDGNGFLYDPLWGGIITKQGSLDSGADFGFGIYNDHHYHLGYFLYAIAVLAKIDPTWGRKYRARAYALIADIMNLSKKSNSPYTRLRCFDAYKLHSWAGGLTEFADGRNQESTSEALNAYYSAALVGLAYGDTHLVATGSTLAAFEIQAAKTWWHVGEGDRLYADEFTRNNRMVGVLWSNKRDSGLWFAPPDWKECRLGIQVLPLLPVTEVVFSDVGFVREFVNWTLPALERAGVSDGWKGFVYAMEGVYAKEGALKKIRSLNDVDDGNSVTNLLWWIHSRDGEEECGCEGEGNSSWFSRYCH